VFVVVFWGGLGGGVLYVELVLLMVDTEGIWGGCHPLSFYKPPTFTHLHPEIVTKNILWKRNEMNDSGELRTLARVTLSVLPHALD